jgi:hypothetical protein
MKISKTHKDFAYRVQKLSGRSSQDVLKHPKNFLGPNWEAVINFWLYLDTLNKERLKVVRERYLTLSREELNVAYGRACNAAQATTKYDKCAGYAAYAAIRGDYSSCFVYPAAFNATYELIGLDKLLENGHQPVFFPMFLNL